MTLPPRISNAVVGLLALLVLCSTAVVMLALDADVLDWLAAIWSALSFWGLVTTLWTTRDTWMELQAERHRKDGVANPAVMSIAVANVRREVVRIGELGSFLFIGVSILVGTNNPLISRTLIVLNLVLLVGNVVFDRLERRDTARLFRETLPVSPPLLAGVPAVALHPGEVLIIQAEPVEPEKP